MEGWEANTLENSIPCSDIWLHDFIFSTIDHVHKTSKEIFLVLWLFQINWDKHLFKYALMSARIHGTLIRETAESTAALYFIFKLFQFEREAFKKSRITSKSRGRNCQ